MQFRDVKRERGQGMDSKSVGQMLPKLNIPHLMYICRDEDGNLPHSLPVVKCTLICCATQSEPQSIFRSLWRRALNWLDGGEEAAWLAGVMFTLRCLYVVFQIGSWRQLNVTHWRSKYRGILGPEQLESSLHGRWPTLSSTTPISTPWLQSLTFNFPWVYF